VYETSVTQAEENERIMESKYKNSLATTTDRIDAQTLLYRARINVELSKASATQAYYNLLKVTGQLHP
jgi:outer membrane protein TolC